MSAGGRPALMRHARCFAAPRGTTLFAPVSTAAAASGGRRCLPRRQLLVAAAAPASPSPQRQPRSPLALLPARPALSVGGSSTGSGTGSDVDVGAGGALLGGPSEAQQHRPGVVRKVLTPGEMDAYLAAHPDRLVVTMCTSQHCKPCKVFRPEYLQLAERFSDFVVLELTGDDSSELRAVMRAWQIKTTPTFRMFRGGQLVHTVSGTRDNKVLDALLAQLLPGEAGADWNLATQQEESWA